MSSAEVTSVPVRLESVVATPICSGASSTLSPEDAADGIEPLMGPTAVPAAVECVADSFGVTTKVESGRLLVQDGIGEARRERR